MKLLLFVAFQILLVSQTFSQKNEDVLYWSAERKLTEKDFEIKTTSDSLSQSNSLFTISFKISGFDFLAKNLNNRVENYFLKSASQINVISGIKETLRYQQTHFDINEIYARKFRKALKENKKSIIKGFKIIEDLNNQIISDCSKRRALYDVETKIGTDDFKQKEWEIIIEKELQELSDFAFEK